MTDQSELKDIELASHFFSSSASLYGIPLPDFLAKKLVSDFKISRRPIRILFTFPTLHRAISELLPPREISLPKLPGAPEIAEGVLIHSWTHPSARSDDNSSPPTETQTMVNDIEREVWLVENAGLVIFTPFIATLFERAGLIRANQFLDKESRISAIFLLHQLSHNQTRAEESQLLLNRLLCNHPLDEAIPPSVDPGENWPDLTSGLIDAVIQHWGSIGNTSHEGLLKTFVRREGSLLFDKDEGWSLHIPEGPFDILLGSLPLGDFNHQPSLDGLPNQSGLEIGVLLLGGSCFHQIVDRSGKHIKILTYSDSRDVSGLRILPDRPTLSRGQLILAHNPGKGSGWA